MQDFWYDYYYKVYYRYFIGVRCFEQALAEKYARTQARIKAAEEHERHNRYLQCLNNEVSRWKDGKRSKPRHIRKTWKGKKKVGCDTRRYRGDGKLLGGHHSGHRWDNDISSNKDWINKKERTTNHMIAKLILQGYDEEQFLRRIHIHPDFGERKPRI